MASSTSCADATSSSVTLASLPAELHSVIARMCRDQDKRYKDRTASNVRARQLEVAKAGATDWDGRSLNALFLVSRSWSKVAAAYIFETVSSKGCSDRLFEWSILPRYALLVRKVVLNDKSLEATNHVTLLRSLPFLYNLRRLTLTPSAFIALLGFGPGSIPTAEHLFHRTALVRATRSVAELSLVEANPERLAWALAPLANSPLKHLDFSLRFNSDDPSLPSARDALRGLKDVRHLSLQSLNVQSGGLLCNPSSFEFKLESLELAFPSGRLYMETWSFVKASSHTLTSLVILLGPMGADDALTLPTDSSEDPPSTAFPVLHHFRLQGTASSIATVLGLLSSSPIVTLDLHIFDYNGKTTPEPLGDLTSLALKYWSATCKRLDVYLAAGKGDWTFFPAPTTRKADKKISQAVPQLKFTAQPQGDAFHHRFKDQHTYTLKKSHEAATDVLNSGVEFANRLLATEDVDGAQALLELLRPLRGKMLREQD